jgi:hypothetical protein
MNQEQIHHGGTRTIRSVPSDCIFQLNYPQLLDALKLLPAERVILDGEIVALDENGRSSF